MPQLPDASVDMILCDLPYGTTACAWDSVIPFDALWAEYRRVIKPRGAIVLTAAQPFTTDLIASNRGMFRYCWYWVKNMVTGCLLANKRPMRRIEDIVVFAKSGPNYFPQGLSKSKRKRSGTKGEYCNKTKFHEYEQEFENYPTNFLEIASENGLHPTQKPVGLWEYLIKTYTLPGDVVLDNCAGSGTTGVACINTGRRFICMEREEKYIEVIGERIDEARRSPLLFTV